MYPGPIGFNTDAIVFDNSPWRPGRDLSPVEKLKDEEDERKLKNLATRVMSNGVEVLVKEKNQNQEINEQRRVKRRHRTPSKSSRNIVTKSNRSLLTSAVTTLTSHQPSNAMLPLQKLLKHNYIIKTCLTTFTYLTTVLHNKKSAVSTFETTISVVTTESLSNLLAPELSLQIEPTRTKFMEVKTIQPSAVENVMFKSNLPKMEKRVDDDVENLNFDLIQPSESGNVPCLSSHCSCSHQKTEGLKTKNDHDALRKPQLKTNIYDLGDIDVRPNFQQLQDTKTQFGPYQYENNRPLAPTDKIVEKYTEVINEYSDNKNHAIRETELLTNEKAPGLPKITKTGSKPEKPKPQKTNKNKFAMADLLKLGSLGIKGLSQLAPVFEKMTGGLMKRHDLNKTTTTTTTKKPATELTAYNVKKRIDIEAESKHSNFPIYIPVDELETSESQTVFSNVSLYQNLGWGNYKHPKSKIMPPKIVHESPLLNGGIPISPGDIITANSDVIVGKPAVGGPLTLAASGVKLQNSMNLPPVDSFVSSNEQFVVREPPFEKEKHNIKEDDSYDLRPPLQHLPKPPNVNIRSQPPKPHMSHHHFHQNPVRPTPVNQPHKVENVMKTEQIKASSIISNHGRPVFLDYIPSLAKTSSSPKPIPLSEPEDTDVSDNSPSSSEVVNTKISMNGDRIRNLNQDNLNKPLLVDIQPSKVANVLIPHGSSTALVFAGSSEPHKSGDYVDDPLPYAEPGYFGSFSIDAPQLTNVHATPTKKQPQNVNPPTDIYEYPPNKGHQHRINPKPKWKDTKRPIDYGRLPPPTSNQEKHVRIGPEITVYNPDIYKPTNGNGEFEKYNNHNHKNKYSKDPKEIIDKDYENYLAVPPPPPNMHYHHDTSPDKNRFIGQKPIVHAKPIQDMKVFLNIQHPVPQPQAHLIMNQGEVPPKVTSEIYFASQPPPNVPSPTYTIHLPNNPEQQNNYWNLGEEPNQDKNEFHFKPNNNQPSNNFHGISPIANSNTQKNVINHGTNDVSSFTVTLNTATNVAGNTGNSGQIIGSSLPVSINNADNTNIPIGTNFAIKVDDDSSDQSYQSEQSERTPTNFGEKLQTVNTQINDNRWNVSTVTENAILNAIRHDVDHYKQTASTQQPSLTIVNTPLSSVNSHANFPMLSQDATDLKENIKPVTEYVDDVQPESKPSGLKGSNLINNGGNMNSHGWYSSLPLDEVKNIVIDTTTKKAIPLIHDQKHKIPEFGPKITSAGKPPSGYWQQNSGQATNLGRPFTKTKDKENNHIEPGTQKANEFFSANYIPQNYNTIKQPVYDIPIRDNSDETTTRKTLSPTTEANEIYENAYEIFDGEKESDQDSDGEISLESMKVPIVSSSDKKYSTINRDIKASTTEVSFVKEEMISKHKDGKLKYNVTADNPYSSTQTEKPFDEKSYNNSFHYQSNDLKPIYDHNSHMRPKPFAADSDISDHQLQQPHLQINQLVENSTNMSYEDSIEGIELNIGEEISTTKTNKPAIPLSSHGIENEYNTINRPVFSLKNHTRHPENNIITSTIHLVDKKPLQILNNINTSSSTLPTFTITSTDFNLNKSSSEIIDLSPPPPTMDYNLKPTMKDETIMGMSPPPPEIQNPISKPVRAPTTLRPIRTPLPFRPKTTRTQPRIPPQRPTRKPIHREEVSTYRPVFDFNTVKKPNYHRDAPSSHLMPPPRDLPSKVASIHEPSTVEPQVLPNVVFPTPVSSGWLTSSGVGFSQNIEFSPSSVHFTANPSKNAGFLSTTEKINYYESQASSENAQETKLTTDHTGLLSDSKESSSEIEETSLESNETRVTASYVDTSTDKYRLTPMIHKNRTRKPYPPRDDILRASASNKYKVQSKVPSITIKPSRTLNNHDILYPTRHLPIRKPVKPILPPKMTITVKPSILESSETFIDDEYLKPTELIKEQPPSPVSISNKISVVEKTPILSDSTVLQNGNNMHASVKPTEVRMSEEIIPTKTEYKTTVVTLTKTLFEPPQTSYSYINHTLTVTKTQTSLLSQFEGATTQTLVLTNTYMSTIVDVVTEIQTRIQPTTIVETVTKHIPIPQIEPTHVKELSAKTKLALDDVTISLEENDNFIIRDEPTTPNIQKIEHHMEGDNDTFFVVINKSQNGGISPPITTDIETSDYDQITRNEELNNNGVSQVLLGEILAAGTPYLETTNVHPTSVGYGKECQPDCKASRNERCQRIDGIMKCVCRPGFARMFPDRPCKPTYTYSVKLALSSRGKEKLRFHENLSDNSSKQYHALALATHEGINRMIMQSDLRDVYHGVHITGFQPIDVKTRNNKSHQGVLNNFYVQLSDNAHESRLKEVIEKYLRNNNYSLGGTDIYAASELVDKLDVTDFDECTSGTFNDCSEHAKCFNLRGTYTCSCLEGFADLSVNTLYPGRICSSEPVGCERCNYHGSCYSRDDQRVLCECFQWYAGSTCHVNLKVVLISLVTTGALLTIVLVICAVVACHKRPRPQQQQQRSIVACIQSMPGLTQVGAPKDSQSGLPSKHRQDRRALINDRGDSGDASSLQNTSLPYIPTKKPSNAKKIILSEPPAHEPPPPPPAPALMIPRARLHPTHRDSRDMGSRKQSTEVCSEEKLISYLESGANTGHEEMMRRKHSGDSSSFSAQKERHKQGALVSAGFKVSTTIRHDEMCMKHDRDDLSSIHKNETDGEMERYDSLRQNYSNEDISQWTHTERRMGELTLSEARSVGGTLPASTGRAASSTRLTHQEANTMAERDLGSTFLLPHVHLYKPDVTSDVSEFDSL